MHQNCDSTWPWAFHQNPHGSRCGKSIAASAEKWRKLRVDGFALFFLPSKSFRNSEHGNNYKQNSGKRHELVHLEFRKHPKKACFLAWPWIPNFSCSERLWSSCFICDKALGTFQGENFQSWIPSTNCFWHLGWSFSQWDWKFVATCAKLPQGNTCAAKLFKSLRKSTVILWDSHSDLTQAKDDFFTTKLSMSMTTLQGKCENSPLPPLSRSLAPSSSLRGTPRRSSAWKQLVEAQNHDRVSGYPYLNI